MSSDAQHVTRKCTPEDPCSCTGRVTSLSVSGRGLNSGAIELVLKPDDGPTRVFLCAIMANVNLEQGKEQGVFAALATLLTGAYLHDRKVTIWYLHHPAREGDGDGAAEHFYQVTLADYI